MFNLFGMGGLDENHVRSLLSQLGSNPNQRMLNMDINRGVLPGRTNPDIQAMNPTQQATMDRYAWGQQGGMGGLPVAAGYEALKGFGQLPGMSNALPWVADKLGFENTADQFNNDETSSPASFMNIGSYIKGAMSPRISDPMGGLGW